MIFTQSWAKPDGGTRQVDSWIGGTSLGAPMLAGMTALANQAWHGTRGPLNPALYRAARAGVFHDIVPSDGRLAVLRNGLNANGKVITRLRSLDHDSSLATAPGWDDVTGLGSPDAFRLLFALGSVRQMRIVSLLPSATEIVGALGLTHLLVGRSAECDSAARSPRCPW